MPDIPNQDAATSKSKHARYALDELLANASTPCALGHDEFAQIRSESKVMGACESDDHRVVRPHQSQVARGLDPLCQGRIGPIVLPKAGLRFHQPPNGSKILARRLSNHDSRPFMYVRLNDLSGGICWPSDASDHDCFEDDCFTIRCNRCDLLIGAIGGEFLLIRKADDMYLEGILRPALLADANNLFDRAAILPHDSGRFSLVGLELSGGARANPETYDAADWALCLHSPSTTT